MLTLVVQVLVGSSRYLSFSLHTLIPVKRRGNNVVLLNVVDACGHIWLIGVLQKEALMFTTTSFMIHLNMMVHYYLPQQP